MSQAEDPLRGLEQRCAGARRIAVLGVGSDLRGDDAAGLLVARQIERAAAKARAESAKPGRGPAFRVFHGGTTPENLTGEIRRWAPTHLVIVDAADFGGEPGAIRLIDPEDAGGVSFSTHSLPLSVLASYIQSQAPCEIMLLGIQPASVEFGAPVSAKVRSAARKVSAFLRRLVAEGAPSR
jgi:hydrogenase 3 maturation protease